MIDHSTQLPSEAALEQDGWALLAPFGEHPKTRFVKKNGKVEREHFIQVLDNQSADLLLSRENSLFRRIRRAVVGIPVYKGHPDLGDYSPETSSPSAKKEIIGAIDRVRKTGRGLEAHFVLTPAGADAVERQGCKYPSALWYVQPVGRRGASVLARPFKLLSAGLTALPNISGVESLANARLAGPTQEPIRKKEPEMKLIAGWLLAHGAVLAHADSPAESDILAALQQIHASASGETAALSNENAALSGENADLKSQISNSQSASAALENEASDLKTQIARLRSQRAASVVDLAIARGKLAVSERTARLQALENSSDFDRDAAALLDSAARFKTIASAESGKILANHGMAGDAREEYCAAVERHMKETGEADPVKAHHAVMRQSPGLAEKLKAR
ncbi:MAG TPA: phage protease [Verrucomicrobiae bacterium]|jgi:hypothetical protein